MFTNAKTVMIGNKEVQSIVTSNGGVLYQKSNNYELVLTCDKDNLNVNETVNFTALLTNNGVPVANELVSFCGIVSDTPTQKVLVANTETLVGCRYCFTDLSMITGSEVVYLDKDHNVYLSYEEGIRLNYRMTPTSGISMARYISNICVENGIVYYRGIGNESEDVSIWDLSVIKSSISGVTINDYGIYGTTDSNGEFTGTYTPTSAGNKTVTAKAMGLSDSVQITVT